MSDLTPLGLSVMLVAVGAGAVLRSFTGFGAALVATVGLSAVLEPSDAVPVVVLVDLVIGLAMLPATRRHADVGALVPVWIGVAVTTPLGVAVLRAVPVTPMRVVIGVVVAASAVLLHRQPRPTRELRRSWLGGAGALSGLLNGAASAGGTPLTLLFYGTRGPQAARRATLSLAFVGMDVIALAVLVPAGLVDATSLVLAAVLTPAVVLVTAMSTRRMSAVDDRLARSGAVAALFLIGVVGVVRAVA